MYRNVSERDIDSDILDKINTCAFAKSEFPSFLYTVTTYYLLCVGFILRFVPVCKGLHFFALHFQSSLVAAIRAVLNMLDL